MRALCGAIITCGAMIAVGLTAQGIGARYAAERGRTEAGDPYLVRISDMDRPLVFALVFSTAVAVIGLGVAFVGLAYHHHRRERDHRLSRDRLAAGAPRIVT